MELLNNEINYRLRSYNFSYMVFEAAVRTKDSLTLESNYINPSKLTILPPESGFTFHPEFATRNLISLFVELEMLEEDKSKKRQHKTAIAYLFLLRETILFQDSITYHDYNEYEYALDSIKSGR